MFKKIAFFALFLAVTGLFAATSVYAQKKDNTASKGKPTKATPTPTPTPTPEPTPEPTPTPEEISAEANPSANLDQCQNGAVGAPTVNCDPGWANGNSNGQNSHYAEGTNIHYRITFKNLVVGTTYQITIGYDTWQGTDTQNAIDYLNNYDATAIGYTVVPCYPEQNTCEPIDTQIMPDDPCHTFDDFDRYFTGWGMDLLDAQFVDVTCNAQERQMVITFKALSTNPVLAWSGHIAKASDWNTVGESSASSINGSPYHMRIIANTGWGGQQDRSLSTTAVVTPSSSGVSVSGQVTDYYGRAISNATLTLVNGFTGESKVASTNTFGFYSFEDVELGDFYTMSVQHSQYSFSDAGWFSVHDNIENLNFQANP